MNQNHRLVNDMMTYCGFSDGTGWADNLCIETALKNGALGAKLTGAGGGGSVFGGAHAARRRRQADGDLGQEAAQGKRVSGRRTSICPHIARQGWG